MSLFQIREHSNSDIPEILMRKGILARNLENYLSQVFSLINEGHLCGRHCRGAEENREDMVLSKHKTFSEKKMCGCPNVKVEFKSLKSMQGRYIRQYI